MPFRKHLCADDHVNVPVGDGAENALKTFGAARRVTVESGDARPGKRARQASSSCCVPTPRSSSAGEPQSGQF